MILGGQHMRVAVVIVACGLVLAACSGGTAAPSAAAPGASSPNAAVPSAAPSAAPSVAVATPEASLAVASAAPSTTTAPENCMDARAYDLLIKPSTDWKTVSPQDRIFAAAALEVYDFSDQEFNPQFGEQVAKALRDPKADIFIPVLWAGQITIISCG